MKFLKIFVGSVGMILILVIFLLVPRENNPLKPKLENQEKENKIEYIIKMAKVYREAERFDEAEKMLKEASKEFTNKEDQKKLQIEIADVHFQWAETLRKKNDHQEAIKHFEMAYRVDKVYRPLKSAVELNNIGVIYYSLHHEKKALHYFEKALPILQALGDRTGEASILDSIGRMYSALGQKNKALEHYEKALAIREEIVDLYGKATTLNNIGNVYSELGQKQRSLGYYERGLIISRLIKDRVNEAAILNNMGTVYSETGQLQKALLYFQEVLSITRAMGDRVGESKTLNNIGQVYYTFGQRQKALEYFEKALIISQLVGDRFNEATALINISRVYSALGQKNKALEYYEKALVIFKELGDRISVVTTLNNIGRVYSEMGHNNKALEYYEKAANICHSMENPVGKANLLGHLGLLYHERGQMHKALEYNKEALAIFKKLKDPFNEATTINNIGVVYSDLGQKQKALECYEKVLLFRKKVGDRFGEAATLNNIGGVYFKLGRKKKALEYYKAVLSIIHSVGDRFGEATTLNNIGGMYSELDQQNIALDYYEKALSISKELGDRFSEANTLNNIGFAYSKLGKKNKALDYHENALLITQALGNKTLEAKIFNNLMVYWKREKNKGLSIFYGKQSVNTFQNLRTNIASFNKKIKKTYLYTKKGTYRYLTEFLITEKRLSEAQQVLDMIKEEEYFEFILGDRSAADIFSTQLDFTEFEKKWSLKYNTVIKKLSTIINEYHLLTLNKNEAEKKRMEELGVQMKEAQKAYKEFLSRMKEAFAKHQIEIEEGKITLTTLTKKARQLQQTLSYLDESEDGKNAALHYLVYGGGISVILTTPSSQSMKQTEIDEKEFDVMIMNYRNLTMKLGEMMRGVKLVDESTDNPKIKELIQRIKKYENKLYDFTFKSVDEELKKYGATNLMISLDGVLRYIPLAALWDGQSFLVQRYRMALITPSSLKNIRDIPVKERKILGLGASRGGQGFAPLPYVRREIRSIVKDEKNGYDGLIKGKAFIDDDFTKDTMVSQLKNKTYPLVHISSHFKFSPGDETKNHLLLGDGTTMKLSEIRRMGKLFDNVRLLVLSACQTGVGGNGEEIDGFGELAQQSGAKSVIASLWPVADESTKELMVNFYRIMKEGKVTSKIGALRQAQLQLAGLEDLLEGDKSKTEQSAKKKTKYFHPYYWGPFIMIGNWR